MKRIWVCFALLLVSAALCVSSYFTVSHAAREQKKALEMVVHAVERKDFDAAKTALSHCRTLWKKKSLPFYMFLDHALFDEFGLILNGLDLYFEDDPDLAAARLGDCLHMMDDMIELQRIDLKNIF